MAKPFIKLFPCMLVGILFLTSCAQPGTATPPPPTAAPLPTAIPEAVAVELGSVGKGTPVAGAWSPDGSRLAIASTQGISIYTRPGWEVENFISLPSRVTEDVDLEFLADGNSLIFRGDGSKDILYEVNLLNNEITELPFRQHVSSRSHLAVSPDGKLLAFYRTQRSFSTDEKNPAYLEILDKASGGVNHSYTSPIDRSSAITSAVFSPDSKLLAVGSEDNHVRMYDLASGEIRLDGSHDSDVKTVAFSPDGKILVSAGNDATIQFWDVETGRNIHTMKDFTETIAFVGYFSHTEEFIIRYQSGSYQKWVLDEEQLPLKQVDFDLAPAESGYSRISSDGKAIVTIQSEKAKVWDLNTGPEGTTLPEYTGSFHDIEFSADGNYLAALDATANVIFWETATGKFSTLLDLKTGYTSDITFKPGDDLLAVAQNDGDIKVWDFFNHSVVDRYQTEEKISFATLQYSPDGSLLAASTNTQGIYIWDTSSGKMRVHLENDQINLDRTSIWFDLNRDEVFATSSNGRSVSSWDLTTGKHIRTVKLSDDSSVPYIDPMHNRVYQRVYLDNSTLLAAWDAVTGQKVFETVLQSCSYSQAVDPTGTLLATYQNNTITFNHLGSMQTLTSVDSVDNPNKMIFSPDKRFLAVQTTTTKTISIINIESVYERTAFIKNVTPPAPAPTPTATLTTAPTAFPEDITEITPVKVPVTQPGAITKDRIKDISDLGTFGFGHLNNAIWSPDSQYFALIGNTNILLYRADTARPVQFFGTNKTSIVAAFSPDSKYLAVNSNEDLTLWDVQSGQALHVWTEYKPSNMYQQISFSPDSQYLQVRKTEYTENTENHIMRSEILLDVDTGGYVGTKAIPDNPEKLAGTISPDGSFAIRVVNQAIHIVDPSSRAIRYTFERPENSYGDVRNWTISPQGKLMLRYTVQTGSGAENSIIEMWDVSINNPPALLWSAEAGPLYVEEGRPFGYPNFAFSPDGKLLAASDKNNMVKVWDAVSGKFLTQLERGLIISFSPDSGSLLLIDNRSFASEWKIGANSTFSPTAEIEGYSTTGMSSSEYISGDKLITIANQKISTWAIADSSKVNVPNKIQFLENTKPGPIERSAEKILAAIQEHGKISIYDANTGSLIKELSQLDEKSDNNYSNFAISHDEKTIASTNYTNSDGKSTILLWDVSSGKVKKEISYPSYHLAQFLFSSNDRLLIGVSNPNSKLRGTELTIWDIETGGILRYFSMLGSDISLHPDGFTLASIQDDGTLSFIDLNTGKTLWHVQSSKNVRDMSFSPDGNLLAVLTSKTIEFWDISTHEKCGELPVNAGNFMFSSDGKYIALGAEDGVHHVWGLKK